MRYFFIAVFAISVILPGPKVGTREYPFAYTMYSDVRNSKTEVRTVEVQFGSLAVTADMFTVDYLQAMK